MHKENWPMEADGNQAKVEHIPGSGVNEQLDQIEEELAELVDEYKVDPEELGDFRVKRDGIELSDMSDEDKMVSRKKLLKDSRAFMKNQAEGGEARE